MAKEPPTVSELRKAAADTVTDINFLLTSNPRFSTGGLYYERQILRDWFARRFPEPAGRG